MKMKRKEGVDQVSDDFSEFSLSSPARKIRRLDHTLPHVLPPIIEEEEDSQPQSLPPYHSYCHNPNDRRPATGWGSVIIEELPSDFDSDLLPPPPRSSNGDHSFGTNSPDQERAIVLFKPVPTPPLYSPSNFSLISLDYDILSEIKNNQFPWSGNSGLSSRERDAQGQEDKNDGCLAVVLWVPSLHVPTPAPVAYPQSMPMETEAMDVELQDNNTSSMDTTTPTIHQQLGLASANAALPQSGIFPQWQQQHCMIPHIPRNSCTPITWSQ